MSFFATTTGVQAFYAKDNARGKYLSHGVALAILFGLSFFSADASNAKFKIDTERSLGYADEAVCQQVLVLLDRHCSEDRCVIPLKVAKKAGMHETGWQLLGIDRASKVAAVIAKEQPVPE